MKTISKIAAATIILAAFFVYSSADGRGPSSGGTGGRGGPPSGGHGPGGGGRPPSGGGGPGGGGHPSGGGYSHYGGPGHGGGWHHGGYYGHGGWSWGLGFGFYWPWYSYYSYYPYYYDYPYYYSPYYSYGYYYAPTYPPRVSYNSPPPSTSESPADTQPEANRPLPPTSVYRGDAGYPEQAPARPAPSAPPPPPRQPMGIADVKALVKAEMADEVVISQIKQSRVVFRLTTAEIIDLKESGVSNKIIDAMLNTATPKGR